MEFLNTIFCLICLFFGLSAKSVYGRHWFFNNGQKHLEKKISTLIEAGNTAVNNVVSLNYEERPAPTCYWIVSPIVALWMSLKFSVNLIFWLKIMLLFFSRQDVEERLEKLKPKSLLRKFFGAFNCLWKRGTYRRTRINQRKIEGVNKGTVQYPVQQIYIDPNNPSLLTFGFFPQFAASLEISITLACPRAADKVTALHSSLPKKGWSDWIFLFHLATGKLSLFTPSKNIYSIFDPIPIINNALSQDNENYIEGEYDVVPQGILTNGEPRDNFLVLGGFSVYNAKKPVYNFMVKCPRCAIDESLFYTLSSARNLVTETLIRIKWTPSPKNIPTFDKMPGYNSQYSAAIKAAIEKWVDDNTYIKLQLTSSHSRVKQKSRSSDYIKIGFLQVFSDKKGIILAQGLTKQWYPIEFSSEIALPEKIIAAGGVPVCLFFRDSRFSTWIVSCHDNTLKVGQTLPRENVHNNVQVYSNSLCVLDE